MNQIILNRFTAGFKALLRKGLKLLVQLLTLAQISDESDSLQPQNEKQLTTTQLGESTHTAVSLRMISRFGGPSGRPGIVKGNEDSGNGIGRARLFTGRGRLRR